MDPESSVAAIEERPGPGRPPKKYQFKKGVCPNPGNIVPIRDLGAELRRILQETEKGDPERRTRLRVIVERLMKDKPELILYYAFGKPRETLKVIGDTTQVNIAFLSGLQTEEIRSMLEGIKQLKNDNGPKVIDIGATTGS